MKRKRARIRESKAERIDGILESLSTSLRETPTAAVRPFLGKEWSRDEREAILDYLHGNTPTEQVQACCYYEYARASSGFHTARGRYDSSHPMRSQLSLEAIRATDFCRSLRDWRGLEILICSGYPEQPWRNLTDAQKEDICVHFVAPRIGPLVTDSFHLRADGVFDEFKKQAESNWTDWMERKGQTRRCQYPAFVGGENDSAKHVVLTLDYSRGQGALEKAFAKWLNSEENKRLFRRFYKKPIDRQSADSPVRYKKHLKSLAAWRLFDELGFKGAAKWTGDNRRYKNDGLTLQPYFGQKLRKTAKGKHFTGPLYKDRRDWKDAIGEAKSFLSQEIGR